MLEQAADITQRKFGESVFAAEEIDSILNQVLVEMHAVASLSMNGFGQEGRSQSALDGCVVNERLRDECCVSHTNKRIQALLLTS